MSLISDALRRREEDGDDGKPAKPSLSLAKPSAAENKAAPTEATPAPPPSTPQPPTPAPEKPLDVAKPKPSPLTLKSHHPKPEPEIAPSPLEEAAIAAAQRPQKKKHKAWVELLVVLLGLVLLVFAGVSLYSYFGQAETATTPVDPATSPPPPPAVPPSAPAEQPPPESAIQPTSPGVFTATRELLAVAAEHAAETGDVVEQAGTGKPEREMPPDEGIEESASAAELPVEDDAQSSLGADPGSTAIENQPDLNAPAPPTETLAPPPVIWPGFSLQAAMGSGKTGSVMIDGSIIKVGESHGELNILEITPGGVLIEYMGERRTFRVRR